MSVTGPLDSLPEGVHTVDQSRWAAWSPREVSDRLDGVAAPWAVAGGWSLDLFLGHETRAHDDLEIAVPAAGFSSVRDALGELDFEVVGDGVAHPLESAAFSELHQTWGSERAAGGVYRVDVFREPHDGDTWICRRDPDIRLPYADVVRRTDDGVPHQAPEIGLLFKAKHARAKDDADLAAVLPALGAGPRRWLAEAVAKVHPGHRWLGRLVETARFE